MNNPNSNKSAAREAGQKQSILDDLGAEQIGEIAERAEMANHNRDYALYRKILQPYPWSHPSRKAIEAAIKNMAMQLRQIGGK